MFAREPGTTFDGFIPESVLVQKIGIKKPAVTGWCIKAFRVDRKDVNLIPYIPEAVNLD